MGDDEIRHPIIAVTDALIAVAFFESLVEPHRTRTADDNQRLLQRARTVVREIPSTRCKGREKNGFTLEASRRLKPLM